MNTAVREFKEETNIDINKYNLFWYTGPIIISYLDAGVIYIHIYYIASLVDQKFKLPSIRFTDNDIQTMEVEDIKWVNLRNVDFFNMTIKQKKRLKKLMKIIFSIYKKKIKSTNL